MCKMIEPVNMVIYNSFEAKHLGVPPAACLTKSPAHGCGGRAIRSYQAPAWPNALLQCLIPLLSLTQDKAQSIS